MSYVKKNVVMHLLLLNLTSVGCSVSTKDKILLAFTGRYQPDLAPLLFCLELEISQPAWQMAVKDYGYNLRKKKVL